MNTTIDTSNYRLDIQGDTAAVSILEKGEWESFTGQLPLAKAVDCIRRLINADHWADVNWTMLDEQDNAAIATALGIQTEETPDTLDGFAIETVDVSEIRRGDQVVYTTKNGTTFFTPSYLDAFHTSWQAAPGHPIIYGDYLILVGGTRERLAPGTTLRRAVDPEAVSRAKWNAHRV